MDIDVEDLLNEANEFYSENDHDEQNYLSETNQVENNITSNLDEKIFVILEQIRISENKILSAIQKLTENRHKGHRNDRTQCFAVNRKGRRCMGYICKKSKYLCYAHRDIAVNKTSKSHLYKKKSPQSVNSDYYTTPGSETTPK